MKSDRAKIHFSKFEDNWEMTTLGGISIKIGDGLHGTPEYSENGDVAFINGNNLIGGKITLNSNTKFVSSNRKTQNDKELEPDTILISINGTIGSLAWYKNENVMLGKSVAYIKISFADKNFVYQLLQTSKVKNYFLNSLTGSTIKNLGLKAIREAPIFIPEINDQKKIGLFFKNLDDLISLHQQELDTLKQTKQGFLQKMFPRKGEKIPEIRFTEFKSEWQKIRLGDQSIIKGRLGWKSLKQEEYILDGPALIAGKHIKNGRVKWDKVDHIPKWRYDESPEIMLENGDVIFSKDGSLGNPALIEDLKIPATINSTMMLVRVNKTLDPLFFYQVMVSNTFKRLVYLKVSGSSIPHLFQADMNDFTFLIPEKSEQVKIGEFFKQLDEVIELKEQELEALKQTKKGFLQKMFV